MNKSIYYFHTAPVAGRSSISKRKVRATVAGIVNGNEILFGIAKCDHEDRNRFSKKIGREIAVKHALSTNAIKIEIPENLEVKYLPNWFVKKAIKLVTSKYSVVIGK